MRDPDPQSILSQVRDGSAPSTWRVFIRKRWTIDNFFSGMLNRADSLLVFTPEGVMEFVNDKRPLTFIAFADLAEIRLQANRRVGDIVQTTTWLDLSYTNGEKAKWQSISFTDNMEVFQCFIEGYSVYKALH